MKCLENIISFNNYNHFYSQSRKESVSEVKPIAYGLMVVKWHSRNGNQTLSATQASDCNLHTLLVFTSRPVDVDGYSSLTRALNLPHPVATIVKSMLGCFPALSHFQIKAPSK